MSTTKAKRKNTGEIEDLDAIIVGAGFFGLYLLARLAWSLD
jgi:cation diffusion facilitator CzcD-associated flavoprotein CzcO